MTLSHHPRIAGTKVAVHLIDRRRYFVACGAVQDKALSPPLEGGAGRADKIATLPIIRRGRGWCSKIILLLAIALVLASRTQAQGIHYSVSMPQPAIHVFQIEETIDHPGVSSVDLALPAWNGLYQIRDFSQFVENLHANVPVKRLDKDTWQFDTTNTDQLKITYAVLANEWSSFSSQLDETHGFFNSADLLLLWNAKRNLPVDLTITPPKGWQVSTSLRPAEKPYTYRADNYDELVDCPVDIGKLDLYSFVVDGVPFQISVDGSHREYNHADLTTMVEQIVRSEIRLMGDLPLKQYNFIYHFNDIDRGGGGMEHHDSTAIHMAMRPGVRSVKDVANVTAHEFFHLWNVKRIRPQGLEPVDYFKENYTSALWFSEGVTSYYADLTLKRAGIINKQELLEELSDEIRTLQQRPAHKTQSAAESSLMTWYDKYPFYRQADQSISYYNKGLLIGLLLDLRIRDATDNKYSLDTVMRYMNENLAKKGRFFADDYGVDEAITQATGVVLDPDYKLFVFSTEELPYRDILKIAGLELNGDRLREMSNPTAKQRRILESWLTGN
jgi:predicted metalloprotease with PDZ domain